MSPDLLLISGGPWCFPRVSGDEPELDFLSSVFRTFSPRERG